VEGKGEKKFANYGENESKDGLGNSSGDILRLEFKKKGVNL